MRSPKPNIIDGVSLGVSAIVSGIALVFPGTLTGTIMFYGGLAWIVLYVGWRWGTWLLGLTLSGEHSAIENPGGAFAGRDNTGTQQVFHGPVTFNHSTSAAVNRPPDEHTYSEPQSPLSINFDPTNPGRKYWSIEPHRDEAGKQIAGSHWEYRALVKNSSSKTLRNVKMTVEAIGALPRRPELSQFDINKSPLIDLAPNEETLAVIARWCNPIIVVGMVIGPGAYGPLRVTVTADDVLPCVKHFEFDPSRTPMVYELIVVDGKLLPSPNAIVPLMNAALFCYESVEAHHVGRMVAAAFAKGNDRLSYFVQSFLVNSVPLYGAEPPSTVPYLIKENGRGSLMWIDGTNNLMFAADREPAYMSCFVTESDLQAHIRYLRSMTESDFRGLPQRDT